MRFKHGPHEIISITLKSETMKRWAYSMDTCSRFAHDIANMWNDSGEKEVTRHENEKPSHVTLDPNLRVKPLICILPLDPYSHPADLVNVVTGLTHMTWWILGMGNL